MPAFESLVAVPFRRVVSLSLLALVLAAAGCADGGGGDGGRSREATRDGGDAVLGEGWSSPCTAAADCVRVSTSCNFCCVEAAVLASEQEQAREAIRQACRTWPGGGVCDCAPVPSEVACRDGRCTLVPR